MLLFCRRHLKETAIFEQSLLLVCEMQHINVMYVISSLYPVEKESGIGAGNSDIMEMKKQGKGILRNTKNSKVRRG